MCQPGQAQVVFQVHQQEQSKFTSYAAYPKIEEFLRMM